MSVIGDDRGATALIVALTMVLIMGVAAVALDGGRAFSEQRQAQGGVDFASLAALQAATGSNPEDAGATEAQAVVAANLPGRTLDWAGCADTSRPAEYTIISSVSDCISFTENFSQARVVLPSDDVGTTFGAVIGFDNITVRTEAEAIQDTQATADILPWTAGTGSSVCLFSNQAPQSVPPCNGPLSGFFGYLDVALYGSGPLDNPSTCELGTSNVRSAINIAKGSDHIMVEWNGGAAVHDHTVCPNKSEDINQLEVQTGSPTNGATEGLITGISGSINGQPFGAADGRIIYDASWSTASASVRGFTLDNTPLWTYLNDPSCPWESGGLVSGDVDNFQEMVACLDDWVAADGDIFSLSLEDAKRFAAVPIFTTYPTGPGSYLIDYFSPVYLETIYQNCNANRCRTIFSPGEAGGSVACPDDLAASPTINCGHGHTSGSDSVEAVTAFQLQLGMLHPDTQEFFPGDSSVRTTYLYR